MSDNKFLSVSEKFYSIQGEGQTMGMPSIFLRLSGCNLLCKSDSWVCDSIDVWKKGIKTPFSEVFTDSEIYALNQGAHLILTGGEPFLHASNLTRFLEWFYHVHHFKPIIEVETNGTIIDHGLAEWIMYFNVSPKLSNSGEKKEKRFNEYALKFFNYYKNAIFKFVISSEVDVEEMNREFLPYINVRKVVLMPAGATQEELNKTRLLVIEQCLKNGLRYCDRLHIVAWNKKTGV